MKNLDTGLLKTFLEVSKTRHFGRAAENLYLTQSAVSFRIRQLEGLLNAQLFERHRNNILLTEAGERLMPHAEAMLAMWQRTFEEVGISDSQRVSLVLGASANLWDAFLQKLIVKAACNHTELGLRTATESAATLSRGVLEHRLDMALLLDPPKNEECETRSIGILELQLIASCPDTPLAELGYTALDWGTSFNLQLSKLLPEQYSPVLHTGQVHIALEYLLTAGGWAWLPSFLAEPHIAAGRLHCVTSVPAIQRQVYVAYRSRNTKIEAINQLITALRQDDTLPLRSASGG